MFRSISQVVFRAEALILLLLGSGFYPVYHFFDSIALPYLGVELQTAQFIPLRILPNLLHPRGFSHHSFKYHHHDQLNALIFR